MTRVADEPFLPYETERTVLRVLEPADASVLAAYRSDPEVARFQDWHLPFTEQDAAEFLDRQTGLDGPAAGQWIQVGIEHEGELVGDLAIGLDSTGTLAMLGYTLRADRQGRGLALEAAGAAVDRLFNLTGVHRVAATLDPDNIRSAMLLERLGFRYEGRSVSAAPVRGAWLDDDRYALLAADRAAWLARPSGPPGQVRLVHLDPPTMRELSAVEVHHSQQRFVPEVRDALIELLFPPIEDGVELTLRLRAIEADDEIVGFVVMQEATAANADPDLRWIAIDRRHQRRGIGTLAVRLVANHERDDEQDALWVRWPDAVDGPGRFFEAVGFQITGVVDGIAAARLDLAAGAG